MDHLPERDRRLARQIETLRNRISELEQTLARQGDLEQQLRTSQQLYRDLFDSTPDGVVLLDLHTGDITGGNPAFERLTGRSLEVLRTFRLWEIVSPASRQAVVDWFRKIVTTPPSLGGEGTSSESFQIPFERPDRRVTWTEVLPGRFSMEGAPHLLCICRDISKRREAEVDLAKRYDLIEKAVSCVQVGLLVIDREYRVLWSNETYRAWFGAADDRLVYCYEVMCRGSEEEPPLVCPDCPARGTFESGKTASIEKVGVETTLGPNRTLWITTTPMPRPVEAGSKPGPPEQVVEWIQDITQFKFPVPAPRVEEGAETVVQVGGPREAVSPYAGLIRRRGGETILVIDDDPWVRDVTTRMLKRLGYQVLLAEEGERAIELAASHTAEIHAAILDMGLPSLGWEITLRHLRDVRPGMKIVLCSGEFPDEQIQAWIDTNAMKFLPKPFRFDTLADTIRTILDTGPAPP